MTRERVAQHFASTCKGPVEIYPLDNLLALKIVLNAALQGGASRSLRMDSLGKSVAAQLLRMEIEAPADLPRLLNPSARPRESGDPGPRTGFPLARE